MKALYRVGPELGQVEIRELDEPKLSNNNVLVEVKAAGICGSDVKQYKGLTNFRAPTVMGHEFSGQIVDVGEDVEGWHAGDRIISECFPYVCGRCYYCLTGEYVHCPNKKVVGAFTKYVALPPSIIHRIPDTLPYDEAALVQPCADAFSAVTRNSDVLPGDTVVVLGPGPIGLFINQVARVNGAGSVIQTGHKGVRLSIAEKIGADVTIAVEEEDTVNRVLELTDGGGADIVYEASGASSAALHAFDLVRRQGQITFMTAPSEQVPLLLGKIVSKELTVKGSLVSKWIDYERCVKLISQGSIKVKPIITHKYPLTDWKKAFDAILNKKAGKVLLHPV